MGKPAMYFLVGLLSAIVMILLGATASHMISIGPLSHHMSVHILLMNILAPIVALSAEIAGRKRRIRPRYLAGAALLQIAALWAAHSPAAVAWTTASTLGNGLVHAMLFIFSVWFWFAVFAQRGANRWQALLMLLITGKLFCLLGALLVFSPRVLYAHVYNHAHMVGSDLSDQQLAGLLMIAVCPLTYVAAAIVIAAKWISDISTNDRTPGHLAAARIV